MWPVVESVLNGFMVGFVVVRHFLVLLPLSVPGLFLLATVMNAVSSPVSSLMVLHELLVWSLSPVCQSLLLTYRFKQTSPKLALGPWTQSFSSSPVPYPLSQSLIISKDFDRIRQAYLQQEVHD